MLWLLLAAQGAGAAVPDDRIAELEQRAAAQGSVRLIVRLDLPARRMSNLRSAVAIAHQSDIARSQQELLTQIRQPGISELKRFRSIPFAVYRADAAGVAKLGRHPRVISLQEDIPEAPTLESSAAVIGAPAAWARGFDGSGQVLAILDTGVATSHPFFAGKLVGEACFSTNDDDGDVTSFCPEEDESSTAPGSGLNCPSNVANCGHGTHVAGIALGNDGTGPNFGIARGASLVSVQVYSRFRNGPGCGGNACALSYPSDQVEALEYLLELNQTLPIAAVNMSLGGNGQTSQATCDLLDPARKEAIDNLRAAGIATIAASGNASQKNAIYIPACISSAISVGSTTDDDAISSFSNVASFLDLLAPGSNINSSVLGGGIGSMNGTSMAAPHVAGAWAVLKQAAPDATVDEILQVLRGTATLVDDERPGGNVKNMRRINLDLALEALVPIVTDRLFIDGFEEPEE